MAAHAHHYLAIFNDNGRPLYLGRSKRIASPEQRLVLHARDRGCTHPGCHVPGYLCQVHHITDWAHDGPTDIDNPTSHKTDLTHTPYQMGYRVQYTTSRWLWTLA
ncbi:hypothetical protein MA5S0921_0171 [Mycobacteroides abscessus 5S-0921]|uniref:DUF222 domain-containing protein n=2 Tax=Mycobacteroides abscessus TaxID=36809 RepID=X8E1H8_9MYCO|nr:hypothetical protein MA5S0421_4904 [Mycobacteroides abscessus 5S-0421]EIU09854.1 hypothetical protein MA5S0304_4670 [Mycobacteroides abscessus 5S-0304]EIU19925.1 hypothetical protein MA5S0708_4596 [Mycobacteroides abscessus 5S-0708]EIU24797.1 hypothetical protein MA5S0817_4220 [Mycobacteroides abscessus 5S-0817]EIU30586.1 hypothetical protein MA5S1212_1750 [Mycobacteroides abscessus 5S-1212]EIV01839.1 hypothetical protein MA5S0921_0171 [Mycobacteroides abscessus 5S-0921]EUA74096.1 hypothet